MLNWTAPRTRFRLPDDTQRVTINGRTGSGKTVFAAWLLSEANFDEMPWTIVDFKGDALLSDLGAKQIDLSAKLQDRPGLYYARPHPHEPDVVEDWLWRVWRAGYNGIFVDEGYMIPERKGVRSTGGPFKTVLTQGRSLHVPVYTLSQRPVDINRHVFTEADFYAVFHLNHEADRKKVTEFTPDDDVWNMDRRLPQHYSRWYDVGNDFSCILKPAPNPKEIKARFAERLQPKKRLI